MKVNKKQAKFLINTVQNWENSGLLSEEVSNSLQKDIDIIKFNWKLLAKYSFWMAIICIIMSIYAALMDKALRDFLVVIFSASHTVKFFISLVFSVIIYCFVSIRKTKYPNKIFSNEAILVFGVMFTAGAIYHLGHVLDTGSGHFSLLILLSFFIYGIIAYIFKSNIVWWFAIVSFGSWLGAETGYLSGWGAYYLGMNYPLRFVILGIILTGIALLLEKKKWFKFFSNTTLIMGLLYLFIALWIMSIFGNYGDIDVWVKIKQIELFYWALLFGITSCVCIYYGIRFDNAIIRGFGITFLFINLYTRFFEYFWNLFIYKAIFFAILGLSFWYLGIKAEKIWNWNLIKTKKKV